MSLSYENINSINIGDYQFVDNIKDRQLNATFDDKDDFKALYKSIEKDGVLMPLVFARIDEKKLEIISGRRRLRAIRKINEKQHNAIVKIPAIIIDNQTPKIDIYMYSYNENNLKDPLHDYQRRRSILLMIYSHNDFQNFIEEYDDKENALYDISTMLLNSKIKQQKKEKLNNKEQILQKIVNDLSTKLFIAKNKLINLITLNILDPDEIELLSNNMGSLEYKDISLARNKSKKTKEILHYIKKALNCIYIEDIDEYETLKNIATKYKLKLSEFYLIDNIDEEYNEEKIEQIDEEMLKKFGNNLLINLAKILKSENEKIENNEQNILKTKQTEAKTKFTSIMKKIDEKKLDELITYLNGLLVNQNKQGEIPNEQ